MTRDGPIALALVAIAAGAVLGAWLRWGLSYWLNPRLPSLPLGTLASNLIGGYLVGIAAAILMALPSLSPTANRLARSGPLPVTITYTGLTSLQMTGSGAVGGDTFKIESLANNDLTRLYGGPNDVYQISPAAHNLDNITGILDLPGAAPGVATGNSTLIVNDQANSASDKWIVEPGALVRTHADGLAGVQIYFSAFAAATINGAQEIKDFIAEVRKTSPTTAILLDEAYSDYATDPSFATAIPTALATPNVVVARTFSKAYGMAGLRQGYAIGHPETIKKMRQWVGSSGTGSLNVFGMAAATVAIAQDASNANFTISPNLLTPTTTIDRDTLLHRDQESLRVANEWLADPRFASLLPVLQTTITRLEGFVQQSNARK